LTVGTPTSGPGGGVNGMVLRVFEVKATVTNTTRKGPTGPPHLPTSQKRGQNPSYITGRHRGPLLKTLGDHLRTNATLSQQKNSLRKRKGTTDSWGGGEKFWMPPHGGMHSESNPRTKHKHPTDKRAPQKGNWASPNQCGPE